MILLVDDDVVNTRVWSHLLTRLRRPSLAVTTACAALEALTTQPVDLLVCAVVLPDADGLTLIERCRAYAHLADLPIIICTGQADEVTVRRALALGVADFIVKPIRADRLLDRLETAFKALPRRWEPRGESVRRLRITTLELLELTALAHAQLGELVGMLRLVVGVPAPPPISTGFSRGPGYANHADLESLSAVPDALAVGAAVRRARDAAATVGALRCASLIDVLWRPELPPAALRSLLDALVVEEAAFAALLSTTPARTGDLSSDAVSARRAA